jgi:hypothetical protein
LWAESLLLVSSLYLLVRFGGPYNGGSDTMTLLALICLWLAHIAPSYYWQEIALGYFAVQVIFSYVQSGWVKLINKDWRSGRALQQVFAQSAYPVSVNVRQWAHHPRLIYCASWAIIVFELAFPLALLEVRYLYVALAIAATFHLANAMLFGLNRFFWAWPIGYPILMWLQMRLFA